MRYFQCTLDSNISFKPTYYIAAGEWFTEDEMLSLIASIGQIEYLGLTVEDEDIEDSDMQFTIGDIQQIPQEEAYGVFFDSKFIELIEIQHLDNRDSIFCLGRVFQEMPQNRYYLFAANAGQEADVTSIGEVKESLTNVYDEAYNDCLAQLKRYFQTSGLDICKGTFVIQAISEDEFQLERASRELVFDSQYLIMV